jgi:HD-GYP domain-containing protein (c-di-GMP phosphodiesterase class II)
MIKKIKVKDLKIGMYVHKFNCGWINHPFLSNSMFINNEEIIQKAIDYGIRELYIDTDKGHEVVDAPTEEEVNRQLQTDIDSIAGQEKADQEIKNSAPISIKEEMAKATEIKKEAKKAIHNIMEDIRFGKQIRTETIASVIDKMVDSVFRNQDALISLGRIKEKDEYTYMHSVGVCILMISFGKYLGFDVPLLREVGMGAMLHDVGKMIVPQNILSKEEQLTEDEIAMMRKHVEYSRMLLQQTEGMSDTAITLASQHHERVDGTGYPLGLKDEDIAYYAKAAAIVDVYDAMTSARCYQDKYQPTEVLRKLYEWSSHHYDRGLVQKLIRCIGIYPIGTLVRLESGLIGIIMKHGEKSLLQPVVRIVFNTKNQSYVRSPYDIDLGNPSGKIGEDRIINYESFERYNINPVQYM